MVTNCSVNSRQIYQTAHSWVVLYFRKRLVGRLTRTFGDCFGPAARMCPSGLAMTEDEDPGVNWYNLHDGDEDPDVNWCDLHDGDEDL